MNVLKIYDIAKKRDRIRAVLERVKVSTYVNDIRVKCIRSDVREITGNILAIRMYHRSNWITM